MLEAMACGIPVVMGDIPQIWEWVEDGVNGFLSPTRDPNPLADKIVRAFEATAQVISKFAAQILTGTRWRRMRRGN